MSNGPSHLVGDALSQDFTDLLNEFFERESENSILVKIDTMVERFNRSHRTKLASPLVTKRIEDMIDSINDLDWEEGVSLTKKQVEEMWEEIIR